MGTSQEPNLLGSCKNLEFQVDNATNANPIDLTDVLHDVLAFDRNHHANLHFATQDVLVQLSHRLDLVHEGLWTHYLRRANSLTAVDARAEDRYDLGRSRRGVGVACQFVDGSIDLRTELLHRCTDSHGLDQHSDRSLELCRPNSG